MEENVEKNLKFSIGIFDEISEKIKNKIIKEASNSKIYAVGVYTDKFVIENFMTYPRKVLEERLEMVKKIQGVDFTFSVDSADPNKVKDNIKKAYEKFINKDNK